MVYPVACLCHPDESAVAHGFHARIFFWNGSKTFQSPEEQSGRGDLPVDFSGIRKSMAERRDGTRVVIKLPGEAAFRVPVGAVQCEMARDLVTQVRIGFLHPGHGGVKAGIGLEMALLNVTPRFQPVTQTAG